jgi:hypothetical protein
VLRQRPFGAVDDRPQTLGGERRVEEDEVEAQLQLVVVTVERRQPLDVEDVCLPQQQPGRLVLLGDGPPPAEHVVGLGSFGVVHLALPEVDHVRVIAGLGRGVVAQLPVLHDGLADVDAKPRHTPVEPEPQDPVELDLHVVAPPVEVGLRREEVVEKVLAAGGVARPGRPPKARAPVVGR